MKNYWYGTTGKWIRRACLFMLDFAFVILAMMAAIALRYENNVMLWMHHYHTRTVLWQIVGVHMLVGVLAGVYGMVWRYAGATEIARLVVTYGFSTLITLLLNQFVPWHMSRPILVITGICVMMFVIMSRFTYKLVREWMKSRVNNGNDARVLIVGAGEGGVYAARICLQNRAKFGQPVAFADDDPLKRRMRINGIPVRGTINEVPEIVKKYSISEIIVAVPGLHGERRNEIVSICKQTHCRTRTLTDPKDTARPMAIRELNTSDFLSRDEVELDNHLIEAYLTDKVVMVTGGGGSIGSEICRQIIRFKPKQLLIFDVYENCAYELECELKQKYGADIPIKVLIGSIRDRVRLDNVFETYQPSVVFHAAAHKHVPLMEVSPAEAIKNNVFGTKNLLESAEAHGVRRLVQLSTDKAVNPTNVMGATKRITEMLLQECARRGKMKCMAVRFGNVLGSHGSVIPLFEAQIKKGGPITLTHPDITRYFMTIPEAAQLVLQAGGLANPGAIYVLDMGEPVKIIDLAKKLIRFYGYEPDVDIPIKIVGLRPGEKLYEELLMDSERDKMTHTAHNKIFVAPPIKLDSEKFEQQLVELKTVAEQNDSDGVVRMLEAIVGTYHPMREGV